MFWIGLGIVIAVGAIIGIAAGVAATAWLTAAKDSNEETEEFDKKVSEILGEKLF